MIANQKRQLQEITSFNNENHYVSKSVPNKIKQRSFYQGISRQLNSFINLEWQSAYAFILENLNKVLVRRNLWWDEILHVLIKLRILYI